MSGFITSNTMGHGTSGVTNGVVTSDRADVKRARVLGCASQGSGSFDESRLVELLGGFDVSLVPFNRSQKWRSFRECLQLLRAGRFDLFVLEGTGMWAGIAAILGRLIWKRRYVVSSGDAVEPFLSGKVPLGAPLFGLYERALYSCGSGFIGWTPYLVGRALTLGAKRAITIPGWAPLRNGNFDRDAERGAIRERLGIPADALVFGIVGSLSWSKRYGYCYGAELVRAAKLSRSQTCVLIVGDGTGLEPLKQLAGEQTGTKIMFTGRVKREEVPGYLAAMDVGSLPQSIDGVGSFRYTTKLPEYREANLLIVTNQIPAAYDLDQGDMLRLKGPTPWSGMFIEALANLMDTLSSADVSKRRAGLLHRDDFSRDEQLARANAFLGDLIDGVHSTQTRLV